MNFNQNLNVWNVSHDCNTTSMFEEIPFYNKKENKPHWIEYTKNHW